MTNSLVHLLENSNFNGVAWGIICILFYLSIYFLVTYFKARDRFYLFYSIYALANAINLLKYIKNIFFEDFITSCVWLFHHLHFPLQYISYVFFALFLLEILQFQTRHPNFYKKVYQSVYILSFLFLLLVISRYTINGYSLLRGYYFYFIMPLGFFITFYSFFLIIKMKDRIKYLILMGMFIISTAAFFTAILSIGEGIEAINKYYYNPLGVII